MSQLDLLADIADRMDPAWRQRGLDAIAQLASTGVEFTAYDLIDRGLLDEPAHPNHMGALMNLARRQGLVRRVGYTQSRRPATRGSALATWRGLGV